MAKPRLRLAATRLAGSPSAAEIANCSHSVLHRGNACFETRLRLLSMTYVVGSIRENSSPERAAKRPSRREAQHRPNFTGTARPVDPGSGSFPGAGRRVDPLGLDLPLIQVRPVR